MSSYLAQEVHLARRHEEILSQRSELLQQMETYLGDKKTKKTWQTQAADTAHKRNAALLNCVPLQLTAWDSPPRSAACGALPAENSPKRCGLCSPQLSYPPGSATSPRFTDPRLDSPQSDLTTWFVFESST
ncbi:uncharacterized protein C3orf14 homolog isoform X2 [Athene cunicularia]|uniref:uncharacterized protein C3orf14 homolog isoform X2 n=1 Tax=Athene cunicularia TaxID=194338 RepID=UPI000EF73CF1|nr:uncharacterized protein C3orf14 homolog isoform X2 [Athene cunicularia]